MKNPIIALLFFLLLSGCSPFIKVYSEEEPAVNYYKYHTFGWLESEVSSLGNRGPGWLVGTTENLIRKAVEKQMFNFGFQTCESKPDLVLHYHVVFRNEIFFMPESWCDEEREYGGRCDRARPAYYNEGTLILDIIDSKNGVQVWRGVAISVLETMQPQELESRVEEAVLRIFKKFPGRTNPIVLEGETGQGRLVAA